MAKALTPEEKMLKITAQRNEEQTGNKAEPVRKAQIRKATDRPARAERSSFNGTKRKLAISDHTVQAFKEAGWHLHIFNETEGRIEQALETGYEFVLRDEVGSLSDNVVPSNTDLGEKVRFRVGSKEGGDGLFAYLMKIPTVEYEEDQRNIQAKGDRVDTAIRSGKNVVAGTSADGFYGQEGISLKHN
jgi:hypothetical protein